MKNNFINKMNIFSMVCILTAFVPVLAACSAKSAPSARYTGGRAVMQEMAVADTAYALEIEAPTASLRAAPMESQIPAEGVERKLVKRANLNIRVENLEAADAAVTGLMARHGAYAASTSIDENSRNYSIRVPSAAYSVFLDGMNGMGRILHRSESAEDVTLHFYDLEGRLSTKRELLKTYQSYLGKAENIEEILSVEERIAELHNEIDGTGKELRNLSNRIDYASIDLYVMGPVSSEPYRGPNMGERIGELFRNFKNFLATMAVALTGLVIYGIPLVLLLIFLFWLLFGRIGLLKKLWRAATGNKRKPAAGA